MRYEHNNPFRLNHVGFLPWSAKRFVLDAPAAPRFRLYRGVVETRRWELDTEGALEERTSELPGRWVGDISPVIREGNYQLHCGEQRSRQFVISRRIYDAPCRMLFAFFQWQRCGHPRGWNGPCHLDDGVIRETGERVDLAGGHHQSCDLRKSIDGVSIGFIGLLRQAMLRAPGWDDGAIAAEVRWNCDYLRKVMHPDGYLRDGLFLEVGPYWGPRYYYNTPAGPSEQWHGISLLALAARYFKDRGDDAVAADCEQAARRIWSYMISDRRNPAPYRSPVERPYGLDGINESRSQIYLGSMMDLASRLAAAADLFRATGDAGFRTELAGCADRLCALQFSGEPVADNPAAACFREAPGVNAVAGRGTEYPWVTAGPLSLCEALEQAPDHPHAGRWRAALRKVAEQFALIAARNVWDRVPGFWVRDDQLERCLARAVRREDFRQAGTLPGPGGPMPCWYRYGNANTLAASHGLLLSRAARLLGEPRFAAVAQRQLDWMLGGNPFDSSAVEGVGYNQLPIPMWELHPPIPQLPGGARFGFPPDHSAEYDLPVAGLLLWLMADLAGGPPADGAAAGAPCAARPSGLAMAGNQ